MMTDLRDSEHYKRLLRAQRKYWHSRVSKIPSDRGEILIDAFEQHPFVMHGVLKIGLVYAHLKQLRPVALPTIKNRRTARELVRSMCPRAIPIFATFLLATLLHFGAIARAALGCRTATDLLRLKLSGTLVGAYIYDHVIRSLRLSTIEVLTWQVRLRIAQEAAYFFAFRHILAKRPIRFVVTSDYSYRYGLLFQLCRDQRIPVLTTIDLYLFTMHKYYDASEDGVHCRAITQEILDGLPRHAEFLSELDEYLAKRFEGRIAHHDVLSAYDNRKRILTAEQLQKEYKLNPRRPLVVVMAHVFCDAPHGTPGMLFNDYHDWFVETVKALANNKNVEFLVKEHPSSARYGEAGRSGSILDQLGLAEKLLRPDIHSTTLLRNADIMVTCSGTIGLEFGSLGKPTIIASRAPYHGTGFAHEPSTREGYLSFLRAGIEKVSPLSAIQVGQARKAAFAAFELFNNYSEQLELGGRFVWGEPFEIAPFLAKLLEYAQVPLESQEIYRKLAAFEASQDTSLINWDKVAGTPAERRNLDDNHPAPGSRERFAEEKA